MSAAVPAVVAAAARAAVSKQAAWENGGGPLHTTQAQGNSAIPALGDTLPGPFAGSSRVSLPCHGRGLASLLREAGSGKGEVLGAVTKDKVACSC